jgi:hypothetical protein
MMNGIREILDTRKGRVIAEGEEGEEEESIGEVREHTILSHATYTYNGCI